MRTHRLRDGVTVSTYPGSTSGGGATRPLSSTGSGSAPRRRGRWDIGVGDAETVLAEARKALFVMVAFLAILWIVQIVNWADHYHLSNEYGIVTRSVSSLPHILSAPFLHLNWTHIEGNSGPLFIFGFLAAYRGVTKFLGVTVFVIVTSGMAAWLFSPSNTVTAGASGVIFGYFGYIMVRGIFDRHAIDIIVGAVMALCFAYQFTVLLPHQGISWQGHIGGLVGGLAAGWIFRDRRVRAVSSGRAPGGLPAPKPSGQLPAKASGTPKASGAPTADTGRADLYKQLDDLGL
jgi:membrane associated rhomboid family serine protease